MIAGGRKKIQVKFLPLRDKKIIGKTKPLYSLEFGGKVLE